MMREDDGGLPVEQFVQALTSQLDRAQEAMQLKVKAGMPLTFAVKDITIDLRAHVEMSGSVIRLRPAQPGDREASVLRFTLTTITRPMIEENTRAFSVEASEPSLNDMVGDDLTEDEKRRLEWAGVRTLSQLQELRRHTGAQAVGRYVDIPAARLRAALDRATHPFIRQVVPHVTRPEEAPSSPLLRIEGVNLKQDSIPHVRIGGASVPVLHATEHEIVAAPTAEHLRTTPEIEVETAPGKVVRTMFNLSRTPGADRAS